MLSKFKTLERHNIGTFSQILNVFSHLPKLKQLVQDGLFYSSLVITSYNEPKYLEENVEYTQIQLLAPRRWMYDHRCKYHRLISQQCPNMRYISFEQFKKYLHLLEKSERDFDQLMQYGGESDNTKKKVDCQIGRNLGKIMIHSMLNVKHLSQYVKLVTGNTDFK